MSAPDFDWHNDDDVVVQEQQAVAVYRNPRGCIVVRQKGDWYGHEDDVWIVIEPDRAGRVAHAILALVEPLPAPGPLSLPAPADRTAAERQRRHRAKRNGPCDRDTVTGDRNGTVTRDAPELFEVHPPD